jgi:hypothetical protein
LTVDLQLYRLLRKVLPGIPPPKEILATEVVKMELATFRGRRRCHIVTGHGFERNEYWLSSWVAEAWFKAGANLRGFAPDESRAEPSNPVEDGER